MGWKRHSCAAQMCAICALASIMATDGRAQESQPPPPEPTPAEQTPAPSLRFEVEVLDFGAVQPGLAVERKVLLHNDSSAPIGILEVFSDCQCTAALAGQEIIMPGESVPISVSMESSVTPGVQVLKHVYVRTTAATEPLKLPVRALSQSHLRMEISELVRTDDGKLSGLLTVSSLDDNDLKIIEIGPPNVLAHISETQAGSGSQSVPFVMQRGADGTFPHSIHVKTTHPLQPEFVHSIREDVRRAFAPSGDDAIVLTRSEIGLPFTQIHLGTARVDEMMTEYFPFMAIADDEPLELLCANANLEFQIIKREPKGRFTLLTIGVRSRDERPLAFRTKLTWRSSQYTATTTIAGAFVR
jgi:Protein of unknown function (DUF1573)